MDKQAVDSKAQSYWEEYFGEYGKAWVRTIPRRIATALAARTAATSKNGEAAADLEMLRVRPIGAPVITEGRITVEGSCLLGSPDGQSRVARLFVASFDDEGRLLDLEAVPVPLQS